MEALSLKDEKYFEIKNFSLISSITALCFYEEMILVGIGPYLHIYLLYLEKEIVRFQVFKSNDPIIRIIPCPKHRILVTSQLEIVEVIIPFSLEKYYLHSSNDLLLDCQINNNILFTASAHGNLKVIKYDGVNSVILNSFNPNESMLNYCAKFFLNNNEILIAWGTIFGSIIIQDCVSFQKKSILKGHSGSIFDIQWINSESLVSASDDRSIRIWNINDVNKPIQEAIFYGHIARIWSVGVISPEYVISTGEDCMLKLWNIKKKILNANIICSKGKNMWRCAYGNGLVATGGYDGVIRIWSLDLLKLQVENKNLSEFPTWAITDQRKIKCILLISTNACIVGISDGKVFIIENKEEKLIFENPSKISAVIISSFLKFDSSKLFAVGFACGEVAILNEKESLSFINTGIGLIRSIKLAINYDINTQKEFNLLISNMEGNFMNWKIEKMEEGKLIPNLEGKGSIKSNKEITSMVSFHKFIICGDKIGRLHNFEMLNNNLTCIFSKRVHAKYEITHLFEANSIIFSIGRDNKLNKYRIQVNGSLEIIQSNYLGNFSAIFNTFYDSQFNEIYLSGYEQNFMKTIRLKNYFELASIYTISNNRPTSSIFDEKGKLLSMANSSKNLLFIYPLNSNHDVSKSFGIPIHSREILCGKFLFEKKCLITGGEDNSINIYNLKDNDLCFKNTLKIHLSSVRALHFFQFNENYFVLSGGGRSQLNLFSICLKDYSVCVNDSIILDKLSTDESDCRINSIDCSILQKNCKISVGTSTGVLYLINVNFNNNKLEIENKINLNFPCQCHISLDKDKDDSSFYLIMGLSNGEILVLVYSIITKESEVLLRIVEKSQSGINCISLLNSPDNTFFLIGTEEGSIALYDFDLKKKGLNSLARKENAHYSSIRAVKIILFQNSIILFSDSYDQQLNIWQFAMPKISKIGHYNHSISDINYLDCLVKKNHIYLSHGGFGNEVLKLFS